MSIFRNVKVDKLKRMPTEDAKSLLERHNGIQEVSSSARSAATGSPHEIRPFPSSPTAPQDHPPWFDAPFHEVFSVWIKAYNDEKKEVAASRIFEGGVENHEGATIGGFYFQDPFKLTDFEYVYEKCYLSLFNHDLSAEKVQGLFNELRGQDIKTARACWKLQGYLQTAGYIRPGKEEECPALEDAGVQEWLWQSGVNNLRKKLKKLKPVHGSSQVLYGPGLPSQFEVAKFRPRARLSDEFARVFK